MQCRTQEEMQSSLLTTLLEQCRTKRDAVVIVLVSWSFVETSTLICRKHKSDITNIYLNTIISNIYWLRKATSYFAHFAFRFYVGMRVTYLRPNVLIATKFESKVLWTRPNNLRRRIFVLFSALKWRTFETLNEIVSRLGIKRVLRR